MKSTILKLAVLASLIGISAQVQAQNIVYHQISGFVLDFQRNPVVSAKVSARGSQMENKTDSEGRFIVSLPEGEQTLSISYPDYTTEEIKVHLDSSDTAPLEIILQKSSSRLDEVVVSANRRVESLSKTPSSVTVVNAEEIESLSIISPNLSNILAYAVPGLGSATNNTGNYGQTLRGRNMLVLIDGIPQTAPLKSAGREIRSIDPSVIERVEVIKGATAIYGNGADGGLINYITKTAKTDKNFGGYSQAGITGNTKGDSTIGYRFSQQFYGKLQKFDYMLSGTYDKTGVFRDAEGSVISPEYGLGETKAYNAFAKLGYSISAKQRLDLTYNYFSSNQDSKFILQPGIYGTKPAIGILGERLGVDEGTRYNHNANLKYSHSQVFGQTSLTANIYLQDFYTTFSNSAFFYGGGQSAISTSKKGFRANLNTPFTISDAVNGDVTYGFDLLNDVTEQKLVDGRTYVPEMKLYNIAPYAQLSTYLFNDLVVKAGLRAENIQIDIDDYNTLAKGPDGQGSTAVKGGDLSYDALVFNTGIRYAKYRFFNPFVSYSQAFSIFDLGRVLVNAKEDAISKLQTEPIIVNNYEAGFSSQLGKLSLTSSIYLSTSELGANTKEVDGFFVPERLPERIWGYEIQADYQIRDSWYVGGSFSHVEGRGDKDDDGDFYGETDIYLKSNRITPDKVTIYSRYANRKLLVDLNWIYIGDRNPFESREDGTYALGEGPIRSFNLLNLALGYKVTTALRASLGIENIFNSSYYTTTSQFYGSNANYTRGNGRRFNFTLGFSF